MSLLYKGVVYESLRPKLQDPNSNMDVSCNLGHLRKKKG